MLLRAVPFLRYFDEGDPPAGDPPAGDGKTLTQDQVNKIVQDRLAKETKKHQAEREKLVKQLETLQQNKGLSDEDRTTLETQIEELRNATMTQEELAKKRETKLQREWESKHSQAEETAKTWQGRYHNLRINNEITRAATESDVIPTGLRFVESFLQPNTRLAEVMGEDNKPTGEFVVKVKFADKDKDGKPVVLDLTVPEAVKRMKDQPEEFGFLFKGQAAGGLGAGTGTPGKPTDVSKMTMEQYMATRKKNPTSVGLA